MVHTAYIALGANLDQPEVTLRAAITALNQTKGIQVKAESSFYRTAPIGMTGQPDFVNAVVQVATTLEPDALLDSLFAIENSFGRIRKERNGPRTLDLDILLYDQIVLHNDSLTLPHPRLHLRAFVLVPLAEITPDLVLPKRGNVNAWLPAVANQAIHRI